MCVCVCVYRACRREEKREEGGWFDSVLMAAQRAWCFQLGRGRRALLTPKHSSTDVSPEIKKKGHCKCGLYERKPRPS